MKVIYEKSIIERINDEKVNADRAGLVIDKIVVTAEEAEKIKGRNRPLTLTLTLTRPDGSFSTWGELPPNCTVHGVRVEVESLPRSFSRPASTECDASPSALVGEYYENSSIAPYDLVLQLPFGAWQVYGKNTTRLSARRLV